MYEGSFETDGSYSKHRSLLHDLTDLILKFGGFSGGELEEVLGDVRLRGVAGNNSGMFVPFWVYLFYFGYDCSILGS